MSNVRQFCIFSIGISVGIDHFMSSCCPLYQIAIRWVFAAIIVATNRASKGANEWMNGWQSQWTSKRVREEWICKCFGTKFHVPKNKLVFASIADGFLFRHLTTRMQANERRARCRYIWSRCIACAHSLKPRHTENILIEFIWKANIQLQKQLIPSVTALVGSCTAEREAWIRTSMTLC